MPYSRTVYTDTASEIIESTVSGFNGVEELYSLWEEIGLDEATQVERKNTVEEHFKGLLDRMISEEKGEVTAFNSISLNSVNFRP